MIARRLTTLFLTLLFMSSGHAITELSGSIGYDKSVYGEGRDDVVRSRSYQGAVAFYFTTLTAIELNYFWSNESNLQTVSVPVPGTNSTITGLENDIMTTVYGIGLRQSFAPRKSFIQPMVSIGYAKQFVENSTYISVRDNGGATAVVPDTFYKNRYDSVFGSFILKFSLTRTLSLTFTVKTVFPAFEFDKARDDMKYLVGFSWIL